MEFVVKAVAGCLYDFRGEFEFKISLYLGLHERRQPGWPLVQFRKVSNNDSLKEVSVVDENSASRA